MPSILVVVLSSSIDFGALRTVLFCGPHAHGCVFLVLPSVVRLLQYYLITAGKRREEAEVRGCTQLRAFCRGDQRSPLHRGQGLRGSDRGCGRAGGQRGSAQDLQGRVVGTHAAAVVHASNDRSPRRFLPPTVQLCDGLFVPFCRFLHAFCARVRPYPRRIQCFCDVSLLSVPCTCVHVSLTALGYF